MQYFPQVSPKNPIAPLEMTPTSLVTHARANSSDPANPPPEALVELIERIRTVAVVGLSRDPTKAARRVPSYMAAKGDRKSTRLNSSH